MDRTTSALALAVLSATCVAGIGHATIWSVVVGGCLLAIVGLSRPRAIAIVHQTALVDPIAVLVSIVNAAVMSSASYALGFVSRWAWGF